MKTVIIIFFTRITLKYYLHVNTPFQRQHPAELQDFMTYWELFLAKIIFYVGTLHIGRLGSPKLTSKLSHFKSK